MIIPPFSITGLQHKHFRDGVDIEVTYTRSGSHHITHINSVRFAYNFSTLEQNYNCTYVTFLNNEGSVVVGGKRIELVPRVRQMMDELEIELITDIELSSVIDVGLADTIDNGRLEAIESELGFTLPRPHKISDLINPDETNFDTMENIEKEAPKRQRTRWELLELD